MPLKEIAKKDLLDHCKSDHSAQAANHAWNKFNSLISQKVKALNSKGKVCMHNLENAVAYTKNWNNLFIIIKHKSECITVH